MKARFPDKPLEAHFHMDFGLGIANTIMALSEGVEVVQSTVLGLGERAGNVPMEETVMALLTLYNIDIGIKTEQLKPLADMVAEISGKPQPLDPTITLMEILDQLPRDIPTTVIHQNYLAYIIRPSLSST